MIVKRVIAVAGDIIKTLPPYPEPEVLVPEGHIWVEGEDVLYCVMHYHSLTKFAGDEPFRTLDSNKFGPVSGHDILRVVFQHLCSSFRFRWH